MKVRVLDARTGKELSFGDLLKELEKFKTVEMPGWAQWTNASQIRK